MTEAINPMEVKLNPGLVTNTEKSQAAARRESIKPAENTMSFERTQALEKTLQETVQVRPEAVARASALAADANYPSDELLDKVAGVLAGSIHNQQA
jgi:hypothetical protein